MLIPFFALVKPSLSRESAHAEIEINMTITLSVRPGRLSQFGKTERFSTSQTSLPLSDLESVKLTKTDD